MTRNNEQGSPLSVDMRLVPWCVGGMALLTILWTALVVWNETAYGAHANWTLACQTMGEKILFAVPGIVLIPIIIAAGSKLFIKLGKDFWRMINYHFPLIGGKIIERRISEWRAEGMAAGIAKKNVEWIEWNNRRMEAERNGVPFDDPPPADFN